MENQKISIFNFDVYISIDSLLFFSEKPVSSALLKARAFDFLNFKYELSSDSPEPIDFGTQPSGLVCLSKAVVSEISFFGKRSSSITTANWKCRSRRILIRPNQMPRAGLPKAASHRFSTTKVPTPLQRINLLAKLSFFLALWLIRLSPSSLYLDVKPNGIGM